MQAASWGTGNRLRIVATLVIVLLTAAIMAGVFAQRSAAAGPRPEGIFSDGSVAIVGGGSAVFGARGLLPGQSVSGRVVIRNAGSADGRFTLAASHLVDRLGPGGGSLARTLELAVVDVTTPGAPRQVYRGTIADLTGAAAGTLAPGVARTFRFTVTFPKAAASQYDFVGSSLSVAFAWTAVSE